MVKSRGEMISNAIINGIGLPIGIVMMILLIINSSNTLGLLFNIFIPVGIIITSIFKSLYYSFDSELFKKFSYISFITTITLLLIYVCISNISVISWVIFGISIALFIINTIFICININWFRYINFICNILLLIGFIVLGLLLAINNLLFISIICLLLLIFIFYYLYESSIIIHYLLSISMVIIELIILLYL